MEELVGDHITNVLLVGQGNLYDGYYDQEELERIGESILGQIKSSDSFLQDHIEEFHKRFNALVEKAQEVSEEDLNSLNNKQLGKVFESYYEKFRELAPFMNTPHTIESFANKKIRGFIEKRLLDNNTEKVESYFNKLSIPSKESPEIKRKKGLLRIAVRINKNDFSGIFDDKKAFESPAEVMREIKREQPKIAEEIRSHVRSWAWMGMQSYLYSPHDLEFVLESLSNIFERKEKPQEQLEELKSERKDSVREMKEVLDDLDPEKEIRELIELLQEYIYLRTKRMEGFKKAYYYTRDLIKEVSDRMDLEGKEIFVVSPEEMITFLKEGKKPESEEIKKRLNSRAFAMKQGEVNLISGEKQVKKFLEEEIEEEIEVKKDLLKGSGAYPGKVGGKVSIVKDESDLDDFEEGDILVTTMTSPELTLAIDKASAIITDEGGMTSHAALISREMQIPCIVGTKAATKVLETGEKVKVDAEAGVVKKLEE